MQLTLKYNEHATHTLSAAFIRGNTPGIWLQEMNAWKIPLEKLACFIVSQNNDPVDAAGLFVVFSKEQLPGILQVRHPYTVLGGKLYIPVNAELSPAISEQELQSLLIWDYQVFHPAIGFIGFERSDRIELADLLQYREPRPVYWEYARAGHTPWIPLRQINVQQLTPEEVFDSIKDEISNKPLEEIPKSNKKEVPWWLNNPIAGGLFKGVYSLISGLGSILPGGMLGLTGGGGSGMNNVGRADDGNPGLFRKIMNWMQEKIEDLEKQRDSELKRLSELFEMNSDEALQYAIPLGSPYLNRGIASNPSGQLTKRPLDFNLRKLGGGYAVDGWNVDNYYDALRTKYLKAAQKAIEEKNFKKAAYVYAHLLGDYTTAADTLRRGKHYREAAVLYKDHLNNLSMAAVCMEEGGMLPEAIDIYTSLNQHEKAGDLYLVLDQKGAAIDCYEKCVVAAAANKDYLEESRIITDKIGDRPRAKKVLLSGWRDANQSEACLVKYFDLLADDNKEQLHTAVKTFYTNNELANKEIPFLSVMDKVNQKYRSEELKNACQHIAYEIVSEQVNAGNPASLHLLRNFVPGDQLLVPDCHRFMHTVKEAPKQKPAPNQWQLMKGVKWQQTLIWQNQLLVWGLHGRGPVLARISWEGHIEYFTWNANVGSNTFMLAVADAGSMNHIVAYANDVLLTKKSLPKNTYFEDELIVNFPECIRGNTIGVGFHNKQVVTLDLRQGEPYLNYYNMGGEVSVSHLCTFSDMYSIAATELREMIFCDDHFYLAGNNGVLRISKKGEIEVMYYYMVEGYIRKIAVNKGHDGSVIIACAFPENITFLTSDESIADPFEIEEIVTVDMTVLPGDRFAVADKNKIKVFDLSDYRSPVKSWEHETKGEVVAVFPGPIRDQLGILESTGQITLHNIRESD